ncbi:hypothetical protein J7394_10015 [Ruegeria sp. R13_0]|uniref:hypothetical protein n=1 Tax=Ruegeria sp. R13_0 TaxID=2821099 RepID=UPI001ADC3F0C|nr:hypothetical protein [Ruegeria sp. R13_0]MBO9434539.1 hypothetical protein [Ruegeria sp. R13_0]
MFRIVILFFAFCCIAELSNATPLNKWEISCGVDKGSIKKKGKTWTFTTSSNKCTGGTFSQRAEINSKSVDPNTKGTYVFSTMVSMKSERNEPFDIFQMHDGRNGCAPPLKVTVLKNNRFKLDADYKTGPGESCVRDVFSQRPTSVTFKRDGSPQKLQVVVQFLGSSQFNVQVALDGKLAAQGSYTPPEGDGYFKSKKFYFKHGVYSKNTFQYKLVSEGMTVKRARK